jgi:vacuolar-type H+-ATPase subunit F/Vma7
VSRIAVLGEAVQVDAFALAGALVAVAERPDDVRAAWASLPEDVGLVLLTPAAAAALPDERIPARDGVLVVTLP